MRAFLFTTTILFGAASQTVADTIDAFALFTAPEYPNAELDIHCPTSATHIGEGLSSRIFVDSSLIKDYTCTFIGFPEGTDARVPPSCRKELKVTEQTSYTVSFADVDTKTGKCTLKVVPKS